MNSNRKLKKQSGYSFRSKKESRFSISQRPHFEFTSFFISYAHHHIRNLATLRYMAGVSKTLTTDKEG